MFLSFIHTNTSCATLQERLHDSDWWFIASSVWSFVTIAYHTWISPAISKWVSLPLIILIACGLPQLVLVLSVTCRQLKGKQMAQYVAGKVSTLLKQTNFQMPIHCLIDWLIPTSTAGLYCQILNKRITILKHLQYGDKYHQCTVMVQSTNPRPT